MSLFYSHYEAVIFLRVFIQCRHDDMQKILILVGSIFVMHSAYAGILEPKRTDPGAITVDKDFRLETDLGYLVNNSSSKNGSSKQDNLTAHILFQKKIR